MLHPCPAVKDASQWRVARGEPPGSESYSAPLRGHAYNMRYIRFRVVPAEGGLHPIDRILAAAPAVTREAIHQISAVTDATATVLYELEPRGAVDDLVKDLEAHEDMLALDVTETDGRLFAYAHFRLNETVRTLLRTENELVLETPLEYADDGALRVTAIADRGVIQRLDPELPDGVDLVIEAVGEYDPGGGRFWSMLTPRQQETLRTAVATGYYRSPREATYADVAAELGIAGGTVGEHLQKVEETILPAVVPGEN